MAYLRDPELIYQQSFSAIRKEADLAHFPQDIANIVVRMIHSCGMTDIAQDIVYTINAASAGKAALIQGSPVLCDSRMVCEGVIRAKLPAENEVLCWNNCPESEDLAKKLGTTRSAAAVDLWRPKLAGAVVAVGNAPTTLFRLLEVLEEGLEPPAVIFGLPVGFVGAAESKELLVKQCKESIQFLTLAGRRGGSAMAAAAVNALITVDG
ncbi:MAG: precorrin-8X methylmutase [Pseudomonadota bacterium]|nr:MAG: precorrin-8X methylmutase [Pseudomonadota bacterium]